MELFGPIFSVCGHFERNDLLKGTWRRQGCKERDWQDALDTGETGKRDIRRQREQQSGPWRKEWKERMIMNLEGNGSRTSTHSKDRERIKLAIWYWEVSLLKRVKILEIRENYSCKQFFGVSFEGTALAIHAGSEPTFHPSKDMEPRVCFGLCCHLQTGSTSAWPVSGLPKCLHGVLHRCHSHSRIFSAGWLERKCVCRWGFCTSPLWGTMSGKKRREGEPMTGFWTWNVGIKIIYNRIYGRIWDLHPEATITHTENDYFLLPLQEAGTWLSSVISWHIHTQKKDWPRFSTNAAFYRAAINLNMNLEEKLVKSIF